jgi:hypothetical protein
LTFNFLLLVTGAAAELKAAAASMGESIPAAPIAAPLAKMFLIALRLEGWLAII